MAPAVRRHDPHRRSRIVDACLDVIAAHGVAGTSHRRVAAAADVPPSGSSGTTDEQRAKQAMRRLHRTEHRWAAAFIAAPVLGFLIFTLYPLGYALYASPTRWNGLTAPQVIGSENYTRPLADP